MSEAASPLRLFVGIAVHPVVREALLHTQAVLRSAVHGAGGRVRWVRPDGMHITLAFLGDTPRARLGAVAAALDAAARGVAPVSVVVEGMGTFGRPTPAALWAGVRAHGALAALQGRVVGALAAAGFDAGETRTFVPHVTLGRVKHWPRDLATNGLFGFDANAAFGGFAARRVTLFQSERRTDGGNVYVPLHDVVLSEGPAARSGAAAAAAPGRP